MKNKIIGGIGMLLGIVALIRWFFSETPAVSGPYQTGRSLGTIIMVIIGVLGAVTFFKESD